MPRRKASCWCTIVFHSGTSGTSKSALTPIPCARLLVLKVLLNYSTSCVRDWRQEILQERQRQSRGNLP